MSKGIGQYDTEYSQCPCFWGTEPGKFVQIIDKYITAGSVLDLGAGEGKNSIFLSKLGFDVTAVEISEYAINNFKTVLEKCDMAVKDRIKISRENVITYQDAKAYDVVIGYGLLHCLSSLNDVDVLVANIKRWVDKNGIVVLVSFNDKLQVPEAQDYLQPTLLPIDYLKKSFVDWNILKYEEDIITETHPTSKIEHQHSLTRIIAQKI
jgi:tellurite methyltransferase